MTNTPALFGWWGVILAWLAWGAINVLRLGVMPELSWSQALRYGLPDVVVWAAFTPLLVGISRRFEIRGERRWNNLGVHIATAILVVIGHSAADAGLATALDLFAGGISHWWLVFVKVLRYQSHTNLLIYMLVTGFVHYQVYAQRLAEESARASRLAAQLTEAKLINLRRQLRPHFLFNALNSIAASMEDSPAHGRSLVRRLGELLRASLRDEHHQLISLAQEIELLRAYLEVEQARFGERLRVTIDARRETLRCQVPSLLLQPIVENAVTHGIAPLVDGGTITVRAAIEGRILVLEVEDDGVGFPTPELGATDEHHAIPRRSRAGSGIGLANTRDRLTTLYGPHAKLVLDNGDGAGARVRLELPDRRSEAA